MNIQLANALALGSALFLASLGVTTVGTSPPTNVAEPNVESVENERVSEIVDARGQRVPVSAYQRIVSLNTVADHLLLQLVEPERLVGVTYYSVHTHPDGWRFGERAAINTSKSVEKVIALRPDLVVASKFADESYMSRLREHGIFVADLGEMRGVEDTLFNIQTLATLLELPQRGAQLADQYRRELFALEARVKARSRPEGIYLTILGDALFGGTKNTSYADLLYFGGVRDAAAIAGYTGWPQYSPEQVLTLDPELIVTSLGRRKLICGHALLRTLSACRQGQVFELRSKIHSDAGLGIVKAAQDLQTLVYGLKPIPVERRAP